MGFFKSMRDLQKQTSEISRNSPPVGEQLASMQQRLNTVSDMMARQTQAANAAATGAGGATANTPVTIVGMKQVGQVNFDLLIEFDLTVTPDGMPPYAATTEQLVSQLQISGVRPGGTLLAAVDPANPAAIWLDLGSLR
jgi:hypothetical protein